MEEDLPSVSFFYQHLSENQREEILVWPSHKHKLLQRLVYDQLEGLRVPIYKRKCTIVKQCSHCKYVRIHLWCSVESNWKQSSHMRPRWNFNLITALIEQESIQGRRGESIEIIDIECGLLSRVSQKIVATKWRIYKGKISSPQDILCRSKRFFWRKYQNGGFIRAICFVKLDPCHVTERAFYI